MLVDRPAYFFLKKKGNRDFLGNILVEGVILLRKEEPMENLKDFIAEKKFLFITGFLALACLLMGILYLKDASAEEAFHCPVETLDMDDSEINSSDKIAVDIKGAVRNPGVYELDNGSVVNDLIKVSGGLLSNADTSNLNLSKKLTNEMVIIVYTKDEVKEMKKSDELGDADITNDLKENSSIIGGSKSNNSTTSSSGKVNLNTATKEELETLYGIGSSKAEAIIKYRGTCGAFTKIEDIKNISGIGDALYAKIKDYITV